MNFAHRLHIVLVIGRYVHVFRGNFSGGRGSGREVYMEDISMDKFYMGEKNFP